MKYPAFKESVNHFHKLRISFPSQLPVFSSGIYRDVILFDSLLAYQRYIKGPHFLRKCAFALAFRKKAEQAVKAGPPVSRTNCKAICC